MCYYLSGGKIMKIKRHYQEFLKPEFAIDLAIRRMFLAGPDNTPSHKTVLATIEVIGGFELFKLFVYKVGFIKVASYLEKVKYGSPESP